MIMLHACTRFHCASRMPTFRYLNVVYSFYHPMLPFIMVSLHVSKSRASSDFEHLSLLHLSTSVGECVITHHASQYP